MSKIKVIHHSKSVGFSGTDRSAQLFCKYLAKSDKYEPFLLYRENDPANTRLEIVRSWIGSNHVIPYHWVPGKKGRIPPYLPESDNLFDVIEQINPQIFHCHASGYNEFPIMRYLAPNAKLVTTNIFGFNDAGQQADMILYISNYVREIAKGRPGFVEGPVLYNPIEQPFFPMTNFSKIYCRDQLLLKYNLPKNAILLGRVGRSDNFDPIALRALSEIVKNHSEVYYLIVNPCENWYRVAKELDVVLNIRFIGPIIDDVQLSMFYHGLDIYAHARSDGEMNPCNIVEAQMHCLPVVSHRSATYNGQTELVGDGGFVVPVGDNTAYRDALLQLIENTELRKQFGSVGHKQAMEYSEASIVTAKLERLYDNLCK